MIIWLIFFLFLQTKPSFSLCLPESVATLPPFSPIEGQKWFDQISSQWESQKNRFALIYFGKIQFLPPCIWNLPFMSTASGHSWTFLLLRIQSLQCLKVINLTMSSSLRRMRSSLVVRASDCQSTSCNGPGFDPSIRRHSGIWGAADEAVLNIVWRKNKKSPQ